MSEGLNPAHNGCTCACHRPGSTMIHRMPCCRPVADQPEAEALRAENARLKAGSVLQSPTSPHPYARYEIGPHFVSEDGEEEIYANSTPNNGLRIGVINGHINPDEWAEFNLSPEQAAAIGLALLRWAGVVPMDAALRAASGGEG